MHACAFMNNDDFTVLVSGGSRCHWVSMCTVWLSHSEWLSKENNESTPNFALSLNIPPQKLSGWFRRSWLWAKWWLAASSGQFPRSCITSCAVFLVKHQVTQVTQRPYSQDLLPCGFWLFPKLKSPLKGKRFQTIDIIQGNMMGQLMVIGRTVWGPKVPTLKGTEVPLYWVQWFLYLQ